MHMLKAVPPEACPATICVCLIKHQLEACNRQLIGCCKAAAMKLHSRHSQFRDGALQLLSLPCCRLQLLPQLLQLLLQCELLGLCLQQQPLAAVALVVAALQLLLKAVVAAQHKAASAGA